MNLVKAEELMEEQAKVPGFDDLKNDLSKSMVKAKASMSEEKEEFVKEHKTEINDDDLSMFPRPRKSCKHCNESGSEGWNLKTEEIVLCRCIKNRIGRVFDPEKLMTYGELKEMYNKPRRFRGLPDIDEKTDEDKL